MDLASRVRATSLAACVLVGCLTVPESLGAHRAAAAQARPYYEGYVKILGGGRVRTSIQGAGWQTVFKERAAGRLRYRACLTHRLTKTSRCWTRTTRADGTSVVFVALFVNDRGGPGPWRATFLVRDRRVATWDFTVLPEPEG